MPVATGATKDENGIAPVGDQSSSVIGATSPMGNLNRRSEGATKCSPASAGARRVISIIKVARQPVSSYFSRYDINRIFVDAAPETRPESPSGDVSGRFSGQDSYLAVG